MAEEIKPKEFLTVREALEVRIGIIRKSTNKE
jgi:hypothetical protein